MQKQKNRIQFILVALLVLIFEIVLLVFFSQKTYNCWDQYQTENAAISHCENHNQ